MKRRFIFLKRCIAVITIALFSHLYIYSYNFTYSFEYNYEGVLYRVNFNNRESCAYGLSQTNPATKVKVQSFTLKGSKIKEITGYSGFDGELIDLETTYTFKPVVIAQAFAGTNITSLQMENTIASIWDGAFENCNNLQSVQLSSALTTIGPKLFTNCTLLNKISIPKSVTTIEVDAFSGSGIESVAFDSGSNLQYIEHDAFSFCENLKSILFPEKLQKIDDFAFYGCSSLTSVLLPNSLTTIGISAFNECSSLKSISIPDNIKRIEEGTFSSCSSLSEVNFGKDTQLWFIGSSAFSNCSSLKSFDMPDKVNSLGEYIFDNTPIEQIKISAALTYINPEGLYLERETLKTLIFGDNSKLKTIGSSLFNDYEKLETVDFGKGSALQVIKSSAFSGCSSLKSVTFSENLTTIEDLAFYNCNNLERLVLPPSITNIGFQPFKCLGLKDIYVQWVESFPSGDNSIFSGNGGWIYENATLHIPVGTESIYSITEPWCSFDKIIPLVPGDPGYTVTINETNFPDAVFREYVSGSTIDKDQNGKLSDEEISAVKTIDVNNLEISDLSGIEFFTALTTLNCRFTNIKSIDLSNNIALKDLDCRNNNLTSLNVSNNTALTSLKCSRNKITSLDVSRNTQLTLLRCNYNKLTELDVSENTKLTRLDCYGNNIGLEKMGILVGSLPTVAGGKGQFYVIDTTLGDEANVCTTALVATAKAKGWKVYNYNNGTSIEYAGSSAEPEPYVVLSYDGKTVTFYYDSNKATRGGIDINNSLMGSSSPYGTATTAVFDVSFANYRPESTAYWFKGCSSLTTITSIKNLNTSNVINMGGMFQDCSSLTSLDLNCFETSNVTNMSYMFYGCSSLTNLDLSSFITSNVTNMNSMFYGCSGLTSLDVSGFNTSNVTDMTFMFRNCYRLTNLDLSGFNTSNVTNMYCMFRNSFRLTNLDLSGFNTSNVTNMAGMFDSCSDLTTIYGDETKWSTESVTNDDNMFFGCTSLVGGNGTVYDANHIDVEYARIDKPGQPGYFTRKEPEMEPIDNADFSNDIDEDTDLDGNVVGDILYNISSGDGSYDSAEGCIVVTTPTDDTTISGQDIFGEDFQSNFTGIVFKVPEGKGTVKVEAQTTDNMVLKVKIGDSDPVTMELEGRLKVSFPYNVTEPTYVYIYGGLASSAAPSMSHRGSASGELKLYGIEVTPDATGIRPNVNDNINDNYYSLDGRKLQGKPTQKGVYIVNGRKVVMK